MSAFRFCLHSLIKFKYWKGKILMRWIELIFTESPELKEFGATNTCSSN